jgi:uncharacterized membrane protein YeaQ/YmgE (transglycosylase-associated protein family)
MGILDVLQLAWFFGLPALILGVAAGRIAKRSGRSQGLAVLIGFGIGLFCGAGVAVLIVRDVESSTSSTAALGLLLVPLGFITNSTTGIVAALVGHSLSHRLRDAH